MSELYRWDDELGELPPTYFRFTEDGEVEVLRGREWVVSEDPGFWLESLQEPFVEPLDRLPGGLPS